MSTTFSAPVFLDKLRAATTQSHTALEALPVSLSIMSPNVTNAEYGLYLSLMLDIVKDAEENIFPVAHAAIPGLDIHSKAQFIEADLKALGYTKKLSYNPLSSGINNPTPAFALGVMYVIEGSSLGGRVILKNISNVLGHNAENGGSYFTGYGSQTGSHWKAFLGSLIEYENLYNAEAEIIAGANFAFHAISTHFTANAH